MGDAAVKLRELAIDPETGLIARSNYFTVARIREGQGVFWADSARHPFAAPLLLFFVPYQYRPRRRPPPPESAVRGTNLQFHANFLCIETYHEEVGCNGVLFNDVYGIPSVELPGRLESEVEELFSQIRAELAEGDSPSPEMLLSYLKVLLIRRTRLKREQQGLRGFQPARPVSSDPGVTPRTHRGKPSTHARPGGLCSVARHGSGRDSARSSSRTSTRP